MNTWNLNGTWRLKYRKPGDEWSEIPAEVPGNVELDLMRAGVLPDLTRGNNVYRALEFEECEWLYETVFRLDALPAERLRLVFDGIDCFATVRLNGAEAGRTANMLIAHAFDVTGLAVAGENRLEVAIAPAVAEGRRIPPSPSENAFPGNWESLRVRKAPHMYGWDIAPRLVSAGIWRGVRLETVPATAFRDIYWTTLEADPDSSRAKMLLAWDLIPGCAEWRKFRLSIRLSHDGETAFESVRPLFSTHGKQVIELTDARFWWPRGSGRPDRYEAELRLFDESGRMLAEDRQRIGIRTVRLSRTAVTGGPGKGDFSFYVNDRRIYIKGSNWVPLDALHSRDAARLEETFAMALDLNCNMLRCWGGNVYEDHAFFELCDANGVLVWQDFSLACFLYPQDREFCDAIRVEAEFIIRKLRNHPSLALWAGNNEIDSAGFDWGPLKSDPNRWDKLSREVLAQAVQTFDPVRDYLPSSPYYAPELIAEGAPHGRKPEDHLWGPRNDFKGDFYMKSNAHFVSEIGYHGCPSPASMRDMLDPEAVWPWRENDQWLTRAVRPMPGEDGYNYRIPLMARQIAVLFDSEPQTLEEFCLASQISQAEADKFFIEKWRSEKEWRGGLLWWNVRDCWPILSDAVVDWYGRRKLAYAYIKASQRDVCTIVTEAAQGVHRPVVVNDTSRPVSGVVTIRDGESGEVLLHADFCCAAGEPARLPGIPAPAAPALWISETRLSGDAEVGRNHYIAGPRPFELPRFRRWLKLLGYAADGFERE